MIAIGHHTLVKHNAHNENNKPIHQNIHYTENRFKQVNWTPKNYVHVVHVVIVPLLSMSLLLSNRFVDCCNHHLA